MILSLGMMFEYSFQRIKEKKFIFNNVNNYLEKLGDQDFTVNKINEFCEFLNER